MLVELHSLHMQCQESADDALEWERRGEEDGVDAPTAEGRVRFMPPLREKRETRGSTAESPKPHRIQASSLLGPFIG